jgi:hypothetical protein
MKTFFPSVSVELLKRKKESEITLDLAWSGFECQKTFSGSSEKEARIQKPFAGNQRWVVWR